ncbi:restriction endonuclease subunit S [Photobacterium damselae]|uniref:restriction endonuclease subunit S n=1 Tax=Photobacterium damselae TaxID=38293 RepID=UPI004067DDEE
MSKYQAYPEYKDSDVEWLGRIPNHWNLKPIKYIFKIENGSTPKSGISEYWDGDITWITPSDLSKISTKFISSSSRCITFAGFNSCGTSLTPTNSLVISSRAPIGSLAITTKESCTNQGCKSLVPKSINNNIIYTYYILIIATEQLNLLGRGTTFLELSSDDLGKFSIPYPPLNEQTQIAAFLDHETAKIDTLIEKQQQLIELLKEKRQAVISHAVTKGLNPDAPMKDSGVEWLGEVPEHWNVAPLKYLVKEKAAGPYGASLTKAMYVSNGVKVYGQQQVINDDFDIGDYYISENKYKEMIRYTVYPDDVLISVMGTVGKVAVVPSTAHHGIINPRLVRYKFNTSKIKPIFVQHLIMSIRYQNRLSEASQGSTMDGLNMGILGDLSLVLPPINEQTQIISEVNHQSSVYNKLINKAENIIVLFQERRTALISAAVTGKIDVRHFTLKDGVAPTTSIDTNEAQQEVTA